MNRLITLLDKDNSILNRRVNHVVLDAGSGLSRLFEPNIRKLVSQKSRLNIVLSHYHFDHVVGLPYLPAVWPEKPIRLFAPTFPYVDTTAEEAIARLINPPFFSFSLENYPNPTQLVPVSSPIKIGNYSFEFLRLEHDGGSVGMNINGKISYITDTFVSRKYFDFIKDSELVLHEVWMTRDEINDKNKQDAMRHSVFEDVIELLLETNIKKLLPVHLNPKWDEEQIKLIFKDTEVDKLIIMFPEEGEGITLS